MGLLRKGNRSPPSTGAKVTNSRRTISPRRPRAGRAASAVAVPGASNGRLHAGVGHVAARRRCPGAMRAPAVQRPRQVGRSWHLRLEWGLRGPELLEERAAPADTGVPLRHAVAPVPAGTARLGLMPRHRVDTGPRGCVTSSAAMPAWRLLMLRALFGVQLRWMRRVRYVGPASLVETADHPQSGHVTT